MAADSTSRTLAAAARLAPRASCLAQEYLAGLPDRPIFPTVTVEELRAALGGPLPAGPTDPERVVRELAAAAEPGVVGMAGGRYFGFVIGGAVPASLGADWLASAWDQNAGLYVGGPSASVVEEVAGAWLVELLGLPPTVSFGFVTGCQMAHFTGLAAARHRVLRTAGWDVEEDGLAGSPPIRVVCGEKRHITVDRALRYLGIGRRAIHPIACDRLGRVDAAALARELQAIGPGPTIVVGQAGEVNTGSFDDLAAVGAAAREAGAWFHIDGAFGLWAAGQPAPRPPARRPRARRLVGDRRAQVAQRPLRLGPRLLCRPGGAPRSPRGNGRLPDPGRGLAPRSGRLDAGVLAARPRLRRLRRDPLARPRRRLRSDRALL